MSEGEIAGVVEIYHFPQLLDCWFTEDEDIIPQEAQRRQNLAKTFLHPFSTAEQFVAEMKPLEEHWEALMVRTKTVEPFELLSRFQAYFQQLLGTGTDVFEEKQHRVRPKVESPQRSLLSFCRQT
jgi:hypothetical protein